jgi:hypothetical protein
MYIEPEHVYNSQGLGGDQTFQRWNSQWIGYTCLHNGVDAGLRLDYLTSYDNKPFDLRLYINLRGVPTLRYQGKPHTPGWY